MGLRGLPSKALQVNDGWVIAANIAADLAAWTRLLGHDDPELRDANPAYAALPRLAPPRPARPPRPPADPRHQPRLAMGGRVPHLLAPALRPARTRLTSTNHPHRHGRRHTPARSEPVRTRAPREPRPPRPAKDKRTYTRKRYQHSQ